MDIDPEKLNKYTKAEDFSEDSFWDKVKGVAKKAGKKVILLALELYYIATDENTPVWAKTAIYGALAYFVLPIDFIPDAIPIAGFSDDMVALATAYKAVSSSAKPKHAEQAQTKWNDWFN